MLQGILLLATFLIVGLPPPAQSATYYISPIGSDANPGTLSKPWLTWTYAFAKSTCGDILLVMDGTYTRVTHGVPIITKVCTSQTVYTIQAHNERQAFIDGDGSNNSFRFLNAQYVTLIGLRIKSADNASGAVSVVSIKQSHHITIKRCLIYENNRYANTHLIENNQSNFNLYEENELYDFHRHGILVYYSANNILRRNYFHARSRAAIPDGYNGTSGDNGTGDDAIAIYPGADNIVENNIADGTMSKGYAVEATSISTNNRFYGNISNGPDRGIELDARGNGIEKMPNNTYIENFVSINPVTGLFGPGSGREGVYSRSARNVVCNQCTVLGSPSRGYVADKILSNPGDGIYSFFITNSLVLNASSGFHITADIQTWSGTNVNAFSNTTNYSLASHANWISKSTTDPQMGTCKVWRPDGSVAKINNWGADILYRYENGILTNVPLWDRTTSEFPHGVLVTGINDVPGQSLFDVHKRLNVNANGCPFPTHFRKSGSDTTLPAAPGGLTAS